MDAVALFEKSLAVKENPTLIPGDTVRVHTIIKEGDKERIQVFEGIVISIKKQNTPARGSFTVRKISFGVGVERSFPFLSPVIDKIEVMRHGQIRRSKLYYLRELKGKAARIKEKRID